MTNGCNHTPQLHCDKGHRQGSWIDQEVYDPQFGIRVRVICRVCGKFYGYLVRSPAERDYVRSRQPPQTPDSPKKPLRDDLETPIGQRAIEQ
jgi:hypothetical protein